MKAVYILGLLLASFAVVEQAEAHGYYVGPTTNTYTVLGCCGDSRTSVQTDKLEGFYYDPFDPDPYGSFDDDDDVTMEQNWGYHWHSRISVGCFSRSHPGYSTNCDEREWVCEWVNETATSSYAKCEVAPNWDTACHTNAQDPHARFGYTWNNVEERETDEDGSIRFVTYSYYYEISRVEKCDWVVVP